MRLRRTSVAIVIGVILQAAFLTRGGTGDAWLFRAWAISAVDHGLFSAYRPPSPQPPTFERPDYPPLSVILLAATGRLVKAVTGELGQTTALTVAVKLLTVLAVAAFLVALRFAPQGAVGSLRSDLLVAAFWLNPALIVNGPILGYFDAPCWAVGLLALVTASAGRPVFAAVLGAASLLLKPQGVFFLLTVLVSAASARERLLVVGASSATLAIVVAPFVVASGVEPFTRAMMRNLLDNNLSGNAFNLWWIVTAAGHIWSDGAEALRTPLAWIPESRFAVATGLLPRPLATIVVAGAAVWGATRVSGTSNLAILTGYCALVLHVFCVLAIAVHENHLVYVVAALGLVAILDARYRGLFLAMTALAALNMLLFYGLGDDLPGMQATGLFLPITVALSAVNIWLLVRHMRAFAAIQSEAA